MKKEKEKEDERGAQKVFFSFIEFMWACVCVWRRANMQGESKDAGQGGF